MGICRRQAEVETRALTVMFPALTWHARYGYDSSTQALNLRMASIVHDAFLARLVKKTQDELSVFEEVEGPPTESKTRSKTFASEVNHNGSGTLEFENSDGKVIGRRQPDAMFQFSGAKWPGVIMEVAYSQQAKELPYLADDYILHSEGNVRVVVGVKLGYHKTKKATISIWRPSYVTNKQGRLVLEATQTLCDEVGRSLSDYCAIADIARYFAMNLVV